MGDKINADELLARVNISDIISQFVPLTKKAGGEQLGICPFHDDSTKSLSVNDKKGIYKCFACGAGGDALDFLMRPPYAYKFHEAVSILTGEKPDFAPVRQKQAIEKKPEWVQIKPNAAPNSFKHWQHGEPSKIWTFTERSGNVIGYTCRFDLPEGKKDVLPLIYASNGIRTEWRFMGFAKPRPLYNLKEINDRPEAPILIVEGEKTADAAKKFFDTAVVTTWIGGGNAVEYTDFSPIYGRTVIFWGDNDSQGIAAMLHIYELIKDNIKRGKFVKQPESAPKGWDVADAAEWDKKTALNFIRANYIEVPENYTGKINEEFVEKNGKPVKIWELPQPDRSSVYFAGFFQTADEKPYWKFVKKPDEPEPIPETKIIKINSGEPSEINEDYMKYFRFLGYSKTEHNTLQYFFYSFEKNLIIGIGSSGFTTPRLIDLAPLDFWVLTFASKSGFDLNGAINWIIRKQSMFGMFDERRVRGRGAWLDNNRIILHCGDHLVVNNKFMYLRDLKTSFMYEQRIPLGIEATGPLPKESAKRVLDMFKLVNWDREINAYLMAGWAVVAPICGVLKWRPHIWITGGAGTGKTWVSSHIIRPLLGEVGLFVQGETTEAGLRQTLVCDALPVVFDEAESETTKNADRVQNVLGLMRQASADDGGLIIKGSSMGTPNGFRIRSAFCLSSIAVGIQQQSDRTRVSVLGIKKLIDQELKEQRWKELQKLRSETLDDKFCEGLRARTIQLIPVILKNTITFAAAATAEIGEQRTGDQLGALLAGAYSLISDSEITYEQAVKWIQARDWNEERGLDNTRDEMSCFSFIMEYMTTVEVVNERETATRFERTIGELVLIASGKKARGIIGDVACNDRLRQFGIKVTDEYIIFGNNSNYLKKILPDKWSANYHKILGRLDGAVEMNSTPFASGIKMRAIKIPLTYLEAPEYEQPKNDIFTIASTEKFELNTGEVPY